MGTRETVLAAALVGCIAVLSPVFATGANAATLLRNSTELFLVGLGMTLLLGAGGIDVSVGIAMGLAAILVGRLLQGNAGPVAAGLAGSLAGGVIGLLTASVVVLGRIPAIVGTLGLFGVYRAAIFLALSGAQRRSAALGCPGCRRTSPRCWAAGSSACRPGCRSWPRSTLSSSCSSA